MPSEADDLLLIREHVASLCAQFDDAYWAECDREHLFPWDFYRACLLYTSDAADERSSVDLGGRRIIKKKNP